MNINTDPPIMILMLFGSRVYFIVLDLNSYLFSINSFVYVVSIIAPIRNTRLNATKNNRKIFLSLIYIKNRPRVI